MSFDNSIPEPKQFFLNLMIKLDFQVADSLFRFNDYNGAINGMNQIISLTQSATSKELRDTAQKLEMYLEKGSGPLSELRPCFDDIQKYLNDRWFCDLRLGIIPTSTIEGDDPKPKTKVFNPNQTSRLR
jgi:hypothetical protein